MDQQQPLVCPSHTTQYIGAVLVGIIVGVGATFVYFKQAPVSAGNNTYQAGFDAAKNRVLESPMGMIFKTPDDIRTLSGSVTAISGNKITIHTESQNPFDDPALADRIVTVTADTKIFKHTQKTPEVLKAEMDVLIKNMQSAKAGSLPATPPPPSTKTMTDIASITVGAVLNVTAVENIKMSKEFLVSEIQIQ